jgi:transcriptional regulator with XRE-family HTH domain
LGYLGNHSPKTRGFNRATGKGEKVSLFHARLIAALDASPKFAGNRAKLSRAIGMSPNYVSTMLSTKASPSWDIAVRIAQELKVSLSYMAGASDDAFDMARLSEQGPITDQALQFFDQIAGRLRQAAVMRGEEPALDDLMMIWYRYGKQLSGFDGVSQWFDLYGAPQPNDTSLRVLAMGSRSLAARTLGRADAKSLQYALSEVPDMGLRQRLVSAYRRAAEEGPVLSEEFLDVLAPGHAEKIRLDYMRLLLPVRDADGDLAIISYSKPLR